MRFTDGGRPSPREAETDMIDIPQSSLKRYPDFIYLFAITLMASMLAYGYWLTNFVLNIDGETTDNFLQTISLGRWFHALLRMGLLPEPFIPYFTNAVALIFISVAACISALVLSLEGAKAVLFTCLFVSFPSLAYQFQFLNQADTFAVGYVLSSSSAYLFVRAASDTLRSKKLGWMVLACMLLSLALGVYQTLIVVPAVLIAGRSLLKSDQETSIKQLMQVSGFTTLFFAGAAMLYALGVILSQGVTGASAQSYASNYLSSQPLMQYLRNVFAALYSLLLGRGAFGFSTYALATASSGYLFIGFLRLHWTEFLVKIMLVLFLLLSPFALVVLSGNIAPPRTYVAANLSFAILFTAAASAVVNRTILLALAVLLGIVHCAAITQLFHSDRRVRDADVQMANRVEAMIRLKYPTLDLSRSPVYFHGGYENMATAKLPLSDVFGSSFFAWDGGNDMRIKGFFRFYGVADYRPVTADDVEKVKSSIAGLPTWPMSDSVALVDDVIVVKLGNSMGWLPFAAR